MENTCLEVVWTVKNIKNLNTLEDLKILELEVVNILVEKEDNKILDSFL